MDCVQRALDDAKLTAAQIDRVVLVGGSTRTPLIGELLEDRLGQPAHREVNPDLCVAMGAAVQAGDHRRAGRRGGAGGHHPALARHQVPGVPGRVRARGPNECKFAPIIKRNTPLPASRSEVFCTVIDSQPTVEIDVYQGESADVRRNHRVGKFHDRGAGAGCRPGTSSWCNST